MMFIQIVLLAGVLISSATAQCPSGGEIYAQGVTAEGQNDVLNAHNNYREQIMQGTVSGQPKGVGLKTIGYDDQIASEATKVSETCEMEHILGEDSRFYVGQNLFISWSTAYSTNQNWTQAVKSWFDENVDFIYPNGAKPGKVTGHYTQVVWGDTYLIGCDFIAFEDKNQPRFPYAKLYTCNYGPGGNIDGEAPYQLA